MNNPSSLVWRRKIPLRSSMISQQVLSAAVISITVSFAFPGPLSRALLIHGHAGLQQFRTSPAGIRKQSHCHSVSRHIPSATAVKAPQVVRIRGGGSLLRLDPNVVKASFSAVAELLVSCGVGAFAAREGILDKSVLGGLSRVVYNLLLPSLLVTTVARTVYSKPLANLLPLPIFAVCQVLFCSLLSRLSLRILRLRPSSIKAREVLVCSTYGNSGVLPILFSSVLLRQHPDKNAVALAISYISFYLLGWSPIFWTQGFNIVAGPNLPVPSVAPLPQKSSLGDRLQHFLHHPPSSLSRILSPPIIGCFGGLLLALSPVAPLFLETRGGLAFITNAIENIGKAYAPIALLVLAGSLALPMPKPTPAPKSADTTPVAPLPEESLSTPLQVAVIALIRFVLCPAGFMFLILTAKSRGLVSSLDKIMMFVLFLESCMPSAQNTVIIHSLMGRQEESTMLARLLLWIYLSSCIPLSILLTLYIQRFGLV